MSKFIKAVKRKNPLGIGVVRDLSLDELETIHEDELEEEMSAIELRSAVSELDNLVKEAGLPGDGPPLVESLSGLSSIVGELKAQLVHLVKVNEALESDIERFKEQEAQGNRERESLIQKIDKMEHAVASSQDVRAEVIQLRKERNTLSDKVHDLDQALAASEQRIGELGQLLDRFRAERNDASAEAACVDSQFSRAMKVIGEQRSELAEAGAREEELKRRAEELEERLERVTEQRELFKVELQESRNALEEVRQSILEASQRSFED